MRRIRAYIINFHVFGEYKIDISSSTFTVPKGVKKIDVFCVGGGGGAIAFTNNAEFGKTGYANGGAGGGYTTTKLSVDVTPGQQLSVVVGAGGNGCLYINGNFNSASDGSKSSIGSICSAAGGFASRSFSGCNGGSGGGGGTWGPCINNGWWEGLTGGAGGTDGGDGGKGQHNYATTGGKGQGTTTRYFGELNGTLYSTGGYGWGANHNNLCENTGYGGNSSFTNGASKNGSSGVCIIRWSGK